jgi:hypothetical protein
MEQLQIGLSSGKNILFITDNNDLISLICKQDIVIHENEEKFIALVIVEERGYRKSITIESWINRVISNNLCGEFILSKHYHTGRMLFDGQVYANGHYNMKLIEELKNLTINSFGRTQAKERISVQIGRLRTLYDKYAKQTEKQGITNRHTNKVVRSDGNDTDTDILYDDALRVVIANQHASVSLLQRRLRVGYTRAARLIDTLEKNNVIGEYCGSKSRVVLIKEEANLQ